MINIENMNGRLQFYNGNLQVMDLCCLSMCFIDTELPMDKIKYHQPLAQVNGDLKHEHVVHMASHHPGI